MLIPPRNDDPQHGKCGRTPNFNTSNLQVADLARKKREIRGAWHHAGGDPGASVRGAG
jgi:hypothetical protein